MSQYKYSVITYLFGDYDKLHEVQGEKEDNVEYICVTDNQNLKSNTWKVVYDNISDDYSPWQKVCDVRYNNIFRYLNSDIFVRVDASFVIKNPKRLTCLVDKFLEGNYDLGTIIHTYNDNVYSEAIGWEREPNFSDQDLIKQVEFFEHFGRSIYQKGLYQIGFFIAKKSEQLAEFDKVMLRSVYDVGTNSKPTRLDQTIFTVVYERCFSDMKMFPLSEEVIHSDAIGWCFHNSDNEIGYNPFKKVVPYVNGKETVLFSL